MKSIARKWNPRLTGAPVHRKDRHIATPVYHGSGQTLTVIDRKRPGRGFRHVLKPKDIRAFIELLPDWDDLSVGLDAIVLAPGSREVYGYHTRGVVHVCAWEEDLWLSFPRESFEWQRGVIERLGVPYGAETDGVLCKFD